MTFLDAKGRLLTLGDVVQWGKIINPKCGRIIKMTAQFRVKWDRAAKMRKSVQSVRITVAHIEDPNAPSAPHQIFYKTSLDPHRVVREFSPVSM